MTKPPFPDYIDSSSRKTAVGCMKQAEYQYIRHLKPVGTSIHLHFGSCLARGLEVFRKDYYGNCNGFDHAMMVGVEAIIKSWQYVEPPDFGSGAKKNIEACVAALISFFDEYPPDSDPVQPVMTEDGPAVEWSFALPIPGVRHPTTGAPMLYVGRFDMLAEMGGAIMVCLTPDHEVLTKEGWKPIENIETGEIIAQWDNGEISFVESEKINVENYKGYTISVEGRKISLCMTPNHRQPLYHKDKGTVEVRQAHNIPKDGKYYIPNFGTFVNREGISRSSDFLKLLVAIQADSTETEYSIRFPLKKTRKIERLEQILDGLSLEYNQYYTSAGYTYTDIKKNQTPVQEILILLGKEKKWGSWLLKFTGTCLSVIVEELIYWDGSPNGKGFVYCTNSDINVYWTRILGTLTGYYTSVYSQQKEDYKPNHRVNFSRELASTQSLRRCLDNYEGPVYCVKIPSSFFVVRRNGKVSITGNCDEKTASQLGANWAKNWKLASQLTGYTWAAKQFGYNVQGIVIRGIGILSEKITHQFIIEKRPQWMIDRWLEQLQRDTKRLIASWEEGYFDYTLDGACSYYGGCPYLPLCTSKDPEPWIEADYEIEVWDPLVKEK